MSFFNDGINLSNAIEKIQINFFPDKVLKKKVNSDFIQTQRSERFELSDSIKKRLSDARLALEDTQNGVSILDTAQQGLSSISENLAKINELTSKIKDGELSEGELKEINSTIKENLEKIQKTVKDTSFNGTKPFDGSSYKNIIINTAINGKINISSDFKEISLKTLGFPEIEKISVQNRKDAEAFQEKVNNAVKDIKSRQERISKTKGEMVKIADNLSIIDTSFPKSKVNTENSEDIEQLKEETRNSLLQDPDVATKSQIMYLDEDIILALINLSL